MEFDGWKERHWTLPFDGERFSLVFFTPAQQAANGRGHAESRQRLEDEAVRLAEEHRMQYRPHSNDCNVLVEIFREHVYGGPTAGDPRWGDHDWSLRGHVVLDVGAHIGTFTVLAAEHGATKVTAFEPEPGNVELLLANTSRFGSKIVVHASAVADSTSADPADGLQYTTLVIGRDNKGVQNTWRHALEGLSHYSGAGGKLQRVKVPLVSFFEEALTEDITFVKLDCEGAELAILQNETADWKGVQRLVFEYSFTKERSMEVFLKAVQRLQAAGFEVMYEGLGAWDALPTWTWHTDALVYCARS